MIAITTVPGALACAARSASRKPRLSSGHCHPSVQGKVPSLPGLPGEPQPCPGSRFRCTMCTRHVASMLQVQE